MKRTQGGVSWAAAAYATILCLLPAPAAQATDVTICYPRDQMLSFIAREYQAEKRASGIVRPYSVMELWVSERTGDWLMVTTDIYDSSCIVSYGEDFAPTAPPRGDAGQPAAPEPSALRLP